MLLYFILCIFRVKCRFVSHFVNRCHMSSGWYDISFKLNNSFRCVCCPWHCHQQYRRFCASYRFIARRTQLGKPCLTTLGYRGWLEDMAMLCNCIPECRWKNNAVVGVPTGVTLSFNAWVTIVYTGQPITRGGLLRPPLVIGWPIIN
jgi:hypothetical protein